MFDNNSKFPRFFISMFIALILLMFVSMFFGATIVGIVYFCALIVMVVFMIMDRYCVDNLANYKSVFILLDVINLVAIVAIVVFEWFKHSVGLNVLLLVFATIEIVMIVFESVKLKNKNINKVESVFIGILKLGSMICLLTYFYNISSLFFAIDAMIFELATFIIKIIFNRIDFKTKSDKISEEEALESIIQSAEDDGGDLD